VTHFYQIHRWLSDLADNSPECLDIFEESYKVPHGKIMNLNDYRFPIDAITHILQIV